MTSTNENTDKKKENELSAGGFQVGLYQWMLQNAHRIQRDNFKEQLRSLEQNVQQERARREQQLHSHQLKTEQKVTEKNSTDKEISSREAELLAVVKELQKRLNLAEQRHKKLKEQERQLQELRKKKLAAIEKREVELDTRQRKLDEEKERLSKEHLALKQLNAGQSQPNKDVHNVVATTCLNTNDASSDEDTDEDNWQLARSSSSSIPEKPTSTQDKSVQVGDMTSFSAELETLNTALQQVQQENLELRRLLERQQDQLAELRSIINNRLQAPPSQQPPPPAPPPPPRLIQPPAALYGGGEASGNSPPNSGFVAPASTQTPLTTRLHVRKTHRTPVVTPVSSEDSSPTEEILQDARRRLRELEAESEAVDRSYREFRLRQLARPPFDFLASNLRPSADGCGPFCNSPAVSRNDQTGLLSFSFHQSPLYRQSLSNETNPPVVSNTVPTVTTHFQFRGANSVGNETNLPNVATSIAPGIVDCNLQAPSTVPHKLSTMSFPTTGETSMYNKANLPKVATSIVTATPVSRPAETSPLQAIKKTSVRIETVVSKTVPSTVSTNLDSNLQPVPETSSAKPAATCPESTMINSVENETNLASSTVPANTDYLHPMMAPDLNHCLSDMFFRNPSSISILSEPTGNNKVNNKNGVTHNVTCPSGEAANGSLFTTNVHTTPVQSITADTADIQFLSTTGSILSPTEKKCETNKMFLSVTENKIVDIPVQSEILKKDSTSSQIFASATNVVGFTSEPLSSEEQHGKEVSIAPGDATLDCKREPASKEKSDKSPESDEELPFPNACISDVILVERSSEILSSEKDNKNLSADERCIGNGSNVHQQQAQCSVLAKLSLGVAEFIPSHSSDQVFMPTRPRGVGDEPDLEASPSESSLETNNLMNKIVNIPSKGNPPRITKASRSHGDFKKNNQELSSSSMDVSSDQKVSGGSVSKVSGDDDSFW